VPIVCAVPIFAQWINYPSTTIPRTADGKPDLAAPAPRDPDGKPDLSAALRCARQSLSLDFDV